MTATYTFDVFSSLDGYGGVTSFVPLLAEERDGRGPVAPGARCRQKDGGPVEAHLPIAPRRLEVPNALRHQ